MGFTTGLVNSLQSPNPNISTNNQSQLGGFTLTATILYLSASLHTRNRAHQRTLLRQQSHLLDNIVAPQPDLPPPTAREIDAGLWATAKDKWNAELEGNLRRVQETDWRSVGERMEEGVQRVWKRAFEKGREVVEK
jgi:altered-inheritance-of-mitochondria protein 5